jgi:hypothetical protein
MLKEITYPLEYSNRLLKFGSSEEVVVSVLRGYRSPSLGNSVKRGVEFPVICHTLLAPQKMLCDLLARATSALWV